MTDHTPSLLQIVNEDKAFSHELQDYMSTKWRMADTGFKYNVVAVFGSQSSGKSTLLNKLFNTDFKVMSDSKRIQTTKGIWLAKSNHTPPFLILDVEGTDGRERGEDQDFERKSSLFALATSQVIIINMWEHVVGLYQGANLGLLKTVLEVNLQLFMKRGVPKTHLFFVIRDHASGTPLASLGETIQADLNKIWAGLNKPGDLDNTKLTDLFDISFTSLAHKQLAAAQFDEGIQKLKVQFTDPTDPAYVFKSKNRVPADGFAQFTSDIWAQINANVDLDLPTQQELLAQFRCDELLALAMDEFHSALIPLKSQLDNGGVVDSLGCILDDGLTEVVGPFDVKASRYHSGVYLRKKTELLERAKESAFSLFTAQIRNAVRRHVTLFKSGLDFKLSNSGVDFYAVVESTRSEVVQQFTETAKASSMTETEWTYEDLHIELQQQLTAQIATRRQAELDKLMHDMEHKLQTQVPYHLKEIITTSPVKWAQLNTAFATDLEATEQGFLTRSHSLRLTDQEQSSAIDQLRTKALTLLYDLIKSSTTDAALLQMLKSEFEQTFRYDAHGIPRVWQPKDDIDTIFRKARDHAELQFQSYMQVDLPCLAEYEAGCPDPVAQLRSAVVSPQRASVLQTRFRRDADTLYTEAKRSMVATTAHIPRWVMFTIAVLGYNEFISILRSPVLLLSIILMGAVGVVVYATGLAGPLQVVARQVAQQVLQVAGQKIREITNGQSVATGVNDFVMNPVNQHVKLEVPVAAPVRVGSPHPGTFEPVNHKHAGKFE